MSYQVSKQPCGFLEGLFEASCRISLGFHFWFLEGFVQVSFWVSVRVSLGFQFRFL